MNAIENHEICSWCVKKFAQHWTFYSQEPTGRGQKYFYTYCQTCWGMASKPVEYECTRDEWIVAKIQGS